MKIMKNILDVFNAKAIQDEYTAFYSITGHLEAIVGGYYVEGEGGCCPDEWIRVYYTEATDSDSSDITDPENLIAYISLEKHYAFVLSKHFEKFQKDSKGYGLMCLPCLAFDSVEYYCSNPCLLPEEFRDIVWIDDDFMNDESILFDFEAFEKIDSGLKYLNPKHFSLKQLMDYLYAPYRL